MNLLQQREHLLLVILKKEKKFLKMTVGLHSRPRRDRRATFTVAHGVA